MNNFIIKIIYLYIITYAILGLLYYFETISQSIFISTVYAGLLNLINAFIAVKLFTLSYKSQASSFMIYNLGGMGLRLFLLLTVLVLVIKFLNIDKYAFILVFFLFYFISLFFEVVFYLGKVEKNKNIQC